MHRYLRNALVASSSLALSLIGASSFAQPPVQQPLEHGMLETSPAQSQYLYNVDLQPSDAPEVKPPIVQKSQIEWSTSNDQPARLDQPQVPGLRF